MKKLYTILAILAVGLLALGMTGCESTTTITDPGTPGAQSDPDYEFVNEEILGDQIYEGIDVSLELSSGLIDSIPGASPNRRRILAEAAGDGDFVLNSWSYSFANDWHVFDFAGYVTDNSGADTIDVTGIDSIQIFSNGQAIQVPDSTMDGFNFNMHFIALNRNGTDSLTADHAIQIAVSGDEGEQVGVINGQLSEVISFSFTDFTDSTQTTSATCQVRVTNSFGAADVTMPIEGQSDCPLDGQIDIAVTLSMDCEGSGSNPFALSIDGSWTATGTFNGTSETFVVSDGANSWTSTEPCGQGPAASAFSL